MKYTVIKGGGIFAIASGEMATLEAAYPGCTFVAGEFPPTTHIAKDGVIVPHPNPRPDPVRQVPPPPTVEQVARALRARLLASTDWTQLPDVQIETREAWAAYRQALRDISEATGFPNEIAWPNPPK